MSELLRYRDHVFIDIERLLELHKPLTLPNRDGGTQELCNECVVPWPCPTALLVIESHEIIVEEPPPVLRVARTISEGKAKVEWLRANPLKWIRWGHRRYPIHYEPIAGPKFLRVYRKDPETGKWGLWVCFLGDDFEGPIVPKPNNPPRHR
jgi:hypothetical protein